MFDWYSDDAERVLSQLQLVFFMLGMGATLTAADFAAIARRPWFLLLGAGFQFLVTPLIALLAAHAFDVLPGIAVGLILVAAMPGGTLAKAFAYLARGNIALSISLTLFGTFAALVAVPALLWLLASAWLTGVGGEGDVSPTFVMPVRDIVLDVALHLILPLTAGMTVARRAPPAVRLAFSRWCIRAGFVVVVVMVAGSLGSGRIDPGEYGWTGPLAIILFCALSQQLSMLPFRLRGWSKPDCVAVGMEVTMRNLNLALLVMTSLFPPEVLRTQPGLAEVRNGVLFVILYYAGVAMAFGLPLALNFRRLIRRDAARAARQDMAVWSARAN